MKKLLKVKFSIFALCALVAALAFTACRNSSGGDDDWQSRTTEQTGGASGGESSEAKGNELTEENISKIKGEGGNESERTAYESKMEEVEKQQKPGFKYVFGGTVKVSAGVRAFATASENPVTVKLFYIAESELTYKEWKDVYDWATSSERGANKYTFAHQGRPGSNGADGAKLTEQNGNQPVANISWRDAIVWCNAKSEKDNADHVNEAAWIKLTPAYTNGITVLRNSKSADVDSVKDGLDTNGYRLPIGEEWEFAARGGDPTVEAWLYQWAGTNSADDLGNYAVYDKNNHTTTASTTVNTANVKSKNPNTAGLYDMCGNVWEMCFEKTKDDERGIWGGSCKFNEGYASFNQAAPTNHTPTTRPAVAMGFRIAYSYSEQK